MKYKNGIPETSNFSGPKHDEKNEREREKQKMVVNIILMKKCYLSKLVFPSKLIKLLAIFLRMDDKRLALAT